MYNKHFSNVVYLSKKLVSKKLKRCFVLYAFTWINDILLIIILKVCFNTISLLWFYHTIIAKKFWMFEYIDKENKNLKIKLY